MTTNRKRTKMNENIDYFVWGEINNKSQSFYLEPDELQNFMKEQELTFMEKNKVNNLRYCRGLYFRDRGFTIERRIKPTPIRK